MKHFKAIFYIIFNFSLVALWYGLLAKVLPAISKANSTLLEMGGVLGVLVLGYLTVVYVVNLIKNTLKDE